MLHVPPLPGPAMNSKAKDLIKVMTTHNYVLVRAKRHAIWQHRLTGHRIVTAMTPSDHKALINITCRAKRGSRQLRSHK